MILGLTPDVFRERFALATFPDGGVLVDLATGNYSRLNASAAAALEFFSTSADSDAAIGALAVRFRISPARVANDLGDLFSSMDANCVASEPPDPLRYRLGGDGAYDLWHGDLLVLHFDTASEKLTLGSLADDLPFAIYDYVSNIAPKLIFLQGTPVLHGSSWRRDDGILGLCGKSKAGKTTTAKALAKHAGTLLSEDLIVLDPNAAAPMSIIGAEAKVLQWSLWASGVLEQKGAAVNAGALRDIVRGPTLPLERIWFLDAGRRGERFKLTSLTRTDALIQIMSHGFLGMAGDAGARRYLAASHAIVSSVTAHEAALPEGLERLDDAISAYVRNSAS